MNIYKTNLFKYIAGDSLVGKSVPMTIERVVIEEIEGNGGRKEEKPVVYFAESKKGMVLNKTNAKQIGKLFGGETDNWVGKTIELYSEEVKAFGELHNAVRVRESKHVKQAQKAKQQAANSTPQERQARLNGNGNLLHGNADHAPIGEDEPSDIDRFTSRVLQEISFYGDASSIAMTLARLGLAYDPENETMLFDELAKDAGREADAKAA